MKILKGLILIVFLKFFYGCEKLVNIDPPQDYLVSPTIFDSDETATSAVTGMYASMMKTDLAISYNLALYTGLYSDELDYDQSAIGLITLYKYALLAQDAPTNIIWNNGFNYIYQANALIEGLLISRKITSAVKDQLLGEAYFTRAFWNYHLLYLYGRLPLVLSTDYASNAKLPRVSEDEIMTQITADLLRAKELLTEKYVASNSIAESQERIRPNSFVASALLARIYLFRKEYKKAEEEADRIIENNKYDISDIQSVFKRTSKEVLWQLELPIGTSYSNSYEGLFFPLTAKPNQLGSNQSSTISAALLSLFGPNDQRRATWIGTFTDTTVTPRIQYHFPAKFKTKTTPADEYTTPFRLAEIYLLRAEARAQQGLLSDAISDVDKIRSRAGIDLLIHIVPDINEQGLLDSICVERRRELFCEWGSRWADIKRSDNIEEIMKRIAAGKGEVWKSTKKLWPIPQNEVLNSANNLKQNDGYN